MKDKIVKTVFQFSFIIAIVASIFSLSNSMFAKEVGKCYLCIDGYCVENDWGWSECVETGSPGDCTLGPGTLCSTSAN